MKNLLKSVAALLLCLALVLGEVPCANAAVDDADPLSSEETSTEITGTEDTSEEPDEDEEDESADSPVEDPFEAETDGDEGSDELTGDAEAADEETIEDNENEEGGDEGSVTDDPSDEIEPLDAVELNVLPKAPRLKSAPALRGAAAPVTFSVTVPTTLAISVDGYGVATAADYTIANNSDGAVCVTALSVNTANDWQLNSYDTTYGYVNERGFGLLINSVDMADGFDAAVLGVIDAGDTMTLPVAASVAPQAEGYSGAIGSIVATINWAGNGPLAGIDVTTPPTKTIYTAGESFDATGMVVTATYADGTEETVTDYTITPSGALSAGATGVMVSYTEDGFTRSTTQAITVNRLSAGGVPTQSNTLTYTGSAQSPTWSGYAEDKLTISGSTSETAAGTYNVTFTPKADYQWSDGSTTAKTASWSIGKAASGVATAPTAKTLTYTGNAQELINGGTGSGGTMQYSLDGSSYSTTIPTATNANTTGYTVYYKVVGDGNHNDTAAKTLTVTIARATPSTPTASKSSISFSSSSTSTTFTVTRSGDGAVTATSSNTSVATVSVSGTTVTVSSVNSTSGTATITVKVNQGTNYNAYTGTGCTVQVNAQFAADGEYGSSKISGTKTKGSTVRFDGKDWIVVNVSGSTYTLILKKMTETTVFGENNTYYGSTLAAKCATFQSNMSANALSAINNKTVQGVTAKVWIATSDNIQNWTETGYTPYNDWYGIRKWTANDGVYDSSGMERYWCSDPSSSNTVAQGTIASFVTCTGLIGQNTYSVKGQMGFRPCVEVKQ